MAFLWGNVLQRKAFFPYAYFTLYVFYGIKYITKYNTHSRTTGYVQYMQSETFVEKCKFFILPVFYAPIKGVTVRMC